jgi:hypothetical protein
MKKYIFFLFTLGFIVFIPFSCQDDALDTAISTPIADQYFNETPLSYEEAVFGMYQKLVFFYTYQGSNWLHRITHWPDDDLTTPMAEDFENFGTITAGNGRIANYYRFAYQLINRANTMLHFMDLYGNTVFENDPDLKSSYEGEARFLRAYIYFRLTDVFGTTPLVSQPVNDLNFIPTNSTDGEVLNFVITELEAAAGLLPQKWDAANLGRATKGSAYGILAKALLLRASNNGYNAADLTAAINAVNQLEGLDYQLVTNWGDNFAGNDAENNTESLFEIQFGQNNSNNVWLDNDNFATVGDLGGYWGMYENHWSMFGGAYMEPSSSLQAVFEDGDPRKDATFRDGKISKYIDGKVYSDQQPSYMNNARVMRYADAVLIKAEALLMGSGNTSAAIALINQVRERARNTVSPASEIPAALDENETDINTIFTWLMDERRRELAGEEGWRWTDLKRWHRAGQIDLANWDFSSASSNFSFDVNKHLLMPFPAAEVQLSEGSLQQNQGY